jgi:single-strand DNA-binding protein
VAELKVGYLNYVVLMGRVTADPDLKYTPKGSPVLKFGIAVNRRYKDPTSGEWKDDPSFFNVTQWGPGAERNGEVLHKGTAIIVEGSLRSRSYQTQAGEKRTVVEVNAIRVLTLEKQAGAGPRLETPPGEAGSVEEVDIPADQVDDVPF